MNLESGRVGRHLEIIYHLNRELARHLDLSEVLSRTLELLVQSLKASGGSIAVIGEDGNLLDASMAVGGSIIPKAVQQLAPALRQGLAGWVLGNGKVALVEDTQNDPRWIPTDPKVAQAHTQTSQPTRSAVSAPLLGREGVVGVITLVHTSTSHFSSEDLRLLAATAETVGLAVENARLYTSEHQRRMFASTLQEVAHIINATLEPEKVFTLILDQLSQIVTFDSASLLLLEGDRLRVAASRGFADPAVFEDFYFPFQPENPSWRTMKDRKAKVIDDVQQTAGWHVNEAIPESKKIRGWLGVPLLVHDKPVGLISIDSHKPAAYTPGDAGLATAFADQAATAVANARLYSESQQQTRTMAMMAETTRMIVSSLDLNEVLKEVLSRVVAFLGVEAGSIALIDEASGDLVFRSATGPKAAALQGRRLKPGQGLAGWVVQNGRPLVVADARLDERFDAAFDNQTGFVTRSVACVPILLREQILGAVEVINPLSGAFSEQSVQVLEYLTGLAASAISHAQLFAQTRAAEQRYLTLFQDSIDPILISDLDGKIVDANAQAAQFTGYSREELLKLRIQALHPVHTAKLGQRFGDIKHGEVRSYESRLRTHSGKQAPVELYVKRIPGPEPDQDTVQWIVRDIAQRADLDELRSDLTSMLFHDMRSPLGNVISSLQLLNDPPPADETVRSLLTISLRSARRLSRMIDSLLDLRRLEEGRAVIKRTKVSLAALAAEAVEEAQPVAEGKGIILQMGIPLSLPSVEADSDMIRRVISNLLDNAVKYTPGGGSIRLTAEPDGSNVWFSVSDTGPGIPAEERHRIFDKYSRIERIGAPKGLGLGLAFCRLAVKAHGGRIWIDSPAEGGAAFRFSLPQTAAAEEASPPAAAD
ncbi:MAG: GAF domain-containing protein [Anaerolineales bacterium]|nr:GAF domain-containing protein [Anaerolineales bacterium]